MSAQQQIENSGAGRLAGRKILITGAANGIGLATAELFLAEGAAVAMLDNDTDKLLEEAKKCSGIPIDVDVSDSKSVFSGVEQAAEHLGGIDGLVNGAAILVRKSVEEFTVEEWERSLAVNLTGPFLLCQAVLPWLRKAGAGTIVSMASGSGIRPLGPYSIAYASSKGGMLTMGKALAIELAPDIRVNTVCPGLTLTAMAGDSFDGYEGNVSEAPIVANYALRRPALPMEIANACLFLTSDESSFITGSTLVADGGRTLY